MSNPKCACDLANGTACKKLIYFHPHLIHISAKRAGFLRGGSFVMRLAWQLHKSRVPRAERACAEATICFPLKMEERLFWIRVPSCYLINWHKSFRVFSRQCAFKNSANEIWKVPRVFFYIKWNSDWHFINEIFKRTKEQWKQIIFSIFFLCFSF